ncbi:uncharacterized protein OCT59_000536 [Rhizophagus irregularis]|uniref:Uncharacterized protein n=1 Tax=Rhizophagus irregularis (strain DAOM 197198w) TaxID=1432141 RepID=A0A015JAT8_RHIIW|nr:hypothetical protein RirG_256880 [Rhizophagus irregularis DAOM 197198w]EXX78999.1 hypothetical protein RirG_009820 [Rhizophagus irregularis DAOM 197198w]UZN99256.1 hypothetical protein OCT59_000536 [Rhizophagus irregularis]
MFDAKDKKAFIYSIKNDRKYESFSKWMNGLRKHKLFKENKSALAIIFLESNPTSLPIASILYETNYSPYWKTAMFINIKDILLLIQKEILPGGKFSGMAVQEINESLEFNFFERSVKSEKKLTIITQGILLKYEVCILDHILQEIHRLFSSFEDVIRVRGTQLVNNKQNNNKEHISFAFLEKQGKPDEADQCIDCMLVVKEKDVCKNCEKLRKTMQQICQRLLIMNSTKTVHASKDILIEKVKKQQRLIKMQNEIILNMKKYLQQKIKLEEVEISDEMANVVYIVANNVASKQKNISNLHPIFQELILIQTKSPNGIRYHLI